VYVGGAKVAALGLRIRNGCCFHGLSLNVDVDLGPFHAIDPCGYPGLQVTRLRDLGIDERADLVADKLLANLADELSSPSRWTKS
jgi:lipoyl(octanoyl) transferase